MCGWRVRVVWGGRVRVGVGVEGESGCGSGG